MPICKGHKKDGTPCGSKAVLSNGYCRHHQDQAPDPSAPDVSGPWTRERLEAAIAAHGSPKGLDLAGADLSCLDLSEMDLHGIILRRRPSRPPEESFVMLPALPVGPQEADLPEIPPEVISAFDASVVYANLRGASLENTNLQGALLDYTNLRGAHLRSANLQGAYLQIADLQGAKLSFANLQEVCLTFANLKEANLMFANLREALLWSTDLQGATLEDARLQGASLDGANLQEALLWSADLQGATLEDTSLQGADFSGANLQGANLNGASLQGANLSGANLRGVSLSGANLQGANLNGVDLKEVDLFVESGGLRGIRLYCAKLDHTRLSREDLGSNTGEEQAGEYRQAQDAYLTLKQNFESLGDYEAASWAYIKERQMEKACSAPWRARRFYGKEQLGDTPEHKLPASHARVWWFFVRHTAKWFSDCSVEALCGYGESIGRVLGWMTVLLLIAGPLLFGGPGLLDWPDKNREIYFNLSPVRQQVYAYLQQFLYVLDAFTTANFAELQPASGLARLFSGLIALLGIFLTGLLGFVVGNRIRRS